MLNEDDYFNQVLQLVRKQVGLDCRHYKLGYLKRRLSIRLRATRRLTYAEYAQLLATDPEECGKLLDRLTINVSHFFRDFSVFKQLKSLVFPELAKRQNLRIWSAGCAYGEEPYTLSMMLIEQMPAAVDWEILATDIDPACLERAREGIYKPQALAEMPLHMRNQYFIQRENLWEIKPEVKKQVRFQINDLTGKLPPGPFDLIICRNVLIYFVSELQEKLYREYHTRLNKAGYLVLGKTESLMGEVRELYKVLDLRERIYQKSSE